MKLKIHLVLLPFLCNYAVTAVVYQYILDKGDGYELYEDRDNTRFDGGDLLQREEERPWKGSSSNSSGSTLSEETPTLSAPP